MSTEQSQIDVSGITVDVVRKDIKNMHVGVYPPNGRVRVAVPRRYDDEAVRLAVVSRLGWIRRQQSKFEAQPRQSKREFVTGESHFVEGKRYRLNVVEHDAPPRVRIANNSTLELAVRSGSSRDRRETILNQWYRAQLRDRIPPLLAKWEPRVGVEVAEVRIKNMKTRWGSCNTKARRVWLNLELAQKPTTCIEYILLHEMVHIIERHHNDRFRDLMDGLMPGWRLRREELSRLPLAHEEWNY